MAGIALILGTGGAPWCRAHDTTRFHIATVRVRRGHGAVSFRAHRCRGGAAAVLYRIAG